jgi:hypothetical protein
MYMWILSRCGGLVLSLLDLVSDSAPGGVLLETPNAPRIHRPNTFASRNI